MSAISNRVELEPMSTTATLWESIAMPAAL
jgi:hypothetical protein